MPSSWTSAHPRFSSGGVLRMHGLSVLLIACCLTCMVGSRFVFCVHHFKYYCFLGPAFAFLCGIAYCARVPLITNHSHHFGRLLRLLIHSLGIGRGLALAM